MRDLKLNLSSYPHGGSWWFPGESEDHTYPGFWHMFAGIGPTVIGYMPDPSYGMIDPGGQNCMELLGVPTENLKATGSTSTHVVKESYTLEDAEFATKITGTVHSQRRQLIGGFDGNTFAYTESGTRAGVPPVWKAVIGTISGLKWKTIIDFGDIDSPGLGETWWTVWSVVPIPRCRPLPEGGWLAGATLYFDPWEMDDWEWTPGGREATFMDTGKGWVPAKYGYDGPLNNDDHAPIYLSGYDEWTYGRSLYGPDALLVYDAEGHLRRPASTHSRYTLRTAGRSWSRARPTRG